MPGLAGVHLQGTGQLLGTAVLQHGATRGAGGPTRELHRGGVGEVAAQHGDHAAPRAGRRRGPRGVAQHAADVRRKVSGRAGRGYRLPPGRLTISPPTIPWGGSLRRGVLRDPLWGSLSPDFGSNFCGTPHRTQSQPPDKISQTPTVGSWGGPLLTPRRVFPQVHTFARTPHQSSALLRWPWNGPPSS